MALESFYASTNNVLILIALGCITTYLWRQRPEYRPSIGLAVGGCLFWSIAWFGLLGSQSLPVELLNPIQEGTTFKNIQHVYGQGAHADQNFWWLQRLYAAVDRGVFPSLRMAVGLNCWLGGINASLMAAISLGVLGHWLGALAITLGYITCLVFIQASLSAGPGHLLSLYFLIGFVFATAMDVLKRRHEQGLILVGLAALLTAAVNTRLEFLAAAVICGGVALVRGFVSDDRVKRISDAGGKRFRAAWRKCALYGERPWVLGTVFAFGVAWAILPIHFSEYYYWEAAVSPFYARNSIYLPFILTSLVYPPIVVLFVLGSWHSFFRLRQFFLLPVLVVVLFNAYYEASHGATPTEMTRYMTYWLPMVFVLALFGWRQLVNLAKRFCWFQGWRLIALLVFGILVTPKLQWTWYRSQTKLPPIASSQDSPSPVDWSRVRRQLGFGSQQAEVGFLVKLVEERPNCIIASIVIEHDKCGGNDPPCNKDDRSLVLLGEPLGIWEKHPVGDEPLKAVRAAVDGRTSCILLYEGFDYAPYPDLALSRSSLKKAGVRVVKAVRVDEQNYNRHRPHVRPAWLRAFDLPVHS